LSSKEQQNFHETLKDISALKESVFEKCLFQITEPLMEKESTEYGACTFEVKKLKIVYRNAKITPTKSGQFVTLWKRKGDGPIQPFDINDNIDLVIINTQKNNLIGQFVFPKSVLSDKGIISNNRKEGKRAFRVYPPWDETTSNQARKTQLWQLEYFLSNDTDKPLDINRAKMLYFQNEMNN
jgi:hypothetical protein